MMVVVDDVDAADERDAVIDQRQLAMQPTQQAALEPPPAGRAKDHQFGAGGLEPGSELCGPGAGAIGVDDDAHGDAAGCRGSQRIGHAHADIVLGEDVGLEPHRLRRGLDRRQQQRKKFVAAFEQPQSVAAVDQRTGGDRQLRAPAEVAPAESCHLEIRDQRHVIRALRPFDASGHTHVAHTEAAHIDAIEGQPRQHARVRARDQRPVAAAPRQQSIEAAPQLLTPVEVPSRLDHVEIPVQNHVDALLPIVEVARQ